MSDRTIDQIPGEADYGDSGRSMAQRLDSTRTCEPPPHRAVRVLLDVHGDTWEDVERVIDELLVDARDGTLAASTRGGSSSGMHAEIQLREVSHDEYVAELNAWRELRRGEA